MPRVAVTLPYFDFFPELRDELARKYPGTKFRTDRRRFEEDDLIDYLKGYEVAVIGLDRFTDRMCRSLPDLKTISLCSAGVDHIDPAILNKYGIKMWWAAGINKVSVSEITVCYMVYTLRRVHFFSSLLRAGEWKGPMGFGADLRGRTVGIHGWRQDPGLRPCRHAGFL
jgi:D-3-phosphoglycerate dehydrogenase